MDCPYYEYGLGGQYCDKVGGKTLLYGYCKDIYEDTDEIHINRSKKKRRNKRERDEKYKNHLKCLYETVGRKHISPVSHTNVIFVRGEGWVKTPRPYYKRLYRSQRSKYLKRQSNKAVDVIRENYLMDICAIRFLIFGGSMIKEVMLEEMEKNIGEINN